MRLSDSAISDSAPVASIWTTRRGWNARSMTKDSTRGSGKEKSPCAPHYRTSLVETERQLRKS